MASSGADFSSWQPLGAHYVRQLKVFERMRWGDDVDLGNSLTAAAPFGGPIAITRDTSKLMELRAVGDDISIYSSSGQLVRFPFFVAHACQTSQS